MGQKIIKVSKSAQKKFITDEVILDFEIVIDGGSEREVRSLAETSVKTLKDKADEFFKDLSHTSAHTDYCISSCGCKDAEGNYDERCCSLIFTLDIVFGNCENLEKVVQYIDHCLDTDFVYKCTYTCALSNKQELEVDLDTSLIKQCEHKAEMILNTTGHRMAGVAEITCKSDHQPLLAKKNNKKKEVDGGFIDDVEERKLIIAESVKCAFYIDESC